MLTALHALLLSLQEPAPAGETRLVVVIAVDQLVPEQLQRLAPRLTGGFGRFLAEGAVFWRATVDYASTETGPGHASLATGRYPSRHGIVGNSFLLRGQGEAYCVGDGAVHPLTSAGAGEGAGSSPVHLVGDALGDLLEARAPGSKTVTIAGKDRSAVLMGGREPDAALWWNGGAGGFTSSTHYGERLPEFASVWNAQWRERARGWEWSCEIEGDPAALGTAPDARAGESKRGGGTLPRTLPTDDAGLDRALVATPLLDYFTLELATLALDAAELGRDGAVDYLGISLSACDVLGHLYGPDSVEVTDLLLRDDRDLGRLFAALDERVGKGRWVACLSADHGVLDLPEALRERGVGARRVGLDEIEEMKALVREAVAGAYPEAGIELAYSDLGFALDEAKLAAAGVDAAEVRALVAEAARESQWVADAYTLEELEASDAPRDPWLALYRNSQFAGRGPDVALRAEPWLLVGMAEGTSHGSPYPYDRRVPLAFLGGRVRAQQRFDAASPVDAVPTLLKLAGLAVPEGLDGRALAVD